MSSPVCVTVVGDAMLDVDLIGSATRLAPDAPVPVVEDLEMRPRPGGAALAASIAAEAGARVRFVTAIGTDAAGDQLRSLLVARAVELVDLGSDDVTITKTRVLAGGRPVVRLDRGGSSGPRDWNARAADACLDADAVLVSDYGRGVANRADASIRPRPSHPVVWDPHPRGGPPVAGTTVVTPNLSEARQFLSSTRCRDSGGVVEAAKLGLQLRRSWRTAGVAVTMGEAGAVYVDGTPIPLVAPAEPVVAADPCGAGDCFAANLVIALAGGLFPSEAVPHAVAKAAQFVAGQSRVPAAPPHKSSDRVVATSGCFDLLHAGHVAMLEAARRLGDRLVVLLNSDASVRRRKGPFRPVVAQADRVTMLRALACVDDVVVFDDDLPTRALERVRPALYVKGADYGLDDLPEAGVLERWGGRAVIVPYLAGRSTTAIVEGMNAS